MKILSEKLAIALIDYDHLPAYLKRDIDYKKRERPLNRMRGDLALFSIDEKYLCVARDFFDNSMLKSIYGERIYRTNEDSFDTLLCLYFVKFFWTTHSTKSEEEIAKFIKGMEEYAINNSIENLWHILNLSNQCFYSSLESNFGSLLTFFSLIEILIISDVARRNPGNYLHDECGRKLPVYYSRVSAYNCPAITNLNNDLSDAEIFEKITILRHKVIHGALGDARTILDEILPMPDGDEYKGNTEDAESSEFQDQIANLNNILRCVLCEILTDFMEDPNALARIKQDISYR